MAYSGTNPFTVGEDLRKADLDVLFNNIVSLKEARRTHDLGGSYHDEVEDTSLVDIPGAVFLEIDGTNLGGLTVDVHVMTLCATGTGYARLYNFTDTAYVGSETSFTNTAAGLLKITGLTLATGLKQYRLRGRGSVSSALPRFWGAKLVIR